MLGMFCFQMTKVCKIVYFQKCNQKNIIMNKNIKIVLLIFSVQESINFIIIIILILKGKIKHWVRETMFSPVIINIKYHIIFQVSKFSAILNILHYT